MANSCPLVTPHLTTPAKVVLEWATEILGEELVCVCFADPSSALVTVCFSVIKVLRHTVQYSELYKN